jgi:hypothetical protein
MIYCTRRIIKMNFSYKVTLEIPVRVEVENFQYGLPATMEYPGDPEEWDDFKVFICKVEIKDGIPTNSNIDITDYLPREVLNSIIDEIPEQAREYEFDAMVSRSLK